MYEKIWPELAISIAKFATGSIGCEFIKFLAFYLKISWNYNKQTKNNFQKKKLVKLAHPMVVEWSGPFEFRVADITNFNIIGGFGSIISGRHSGLKNRKIV